MSKKRMLAVLETYEVGSFKKEFVDRIKCIKKKKKKKNQGYKDEKWALV